MPSAVSATEKPGSLQHDGSRRFVQPADVRGRFTRIRRLVFALLIGLYVALPWIQIGGHPAAFLDIEQRRFFLFGATFNAQDVWLVFFLISGAGFGLIALTAVLGRVWCGYACPQTVFLEGVFRRVERWLEGPREARLRRNRAPWTLDWVWRKTLKHVMFAALSLILAHVFLSYFTSLPALFRWVRLSPAQHPEAFGWVIGLSVLMYVNFAWFREQLCLIVCPYGRLQSVLMDRDSIVIGYDAGRGEPRGKVGRVGAGDCVDCHRCVVVCPTAIDIRNGLQLECVGCAACVDACDEIMTNLGRRTGLVRYDSLNGLEGRPRRLLRPRLLLYGALGLVGTTAAAFAFVGRSPFEANLLRTQGPPFVVDGDQVRNGFTVHVVNKSPDTATFRLEPRRADGVAFIVPVPIASVPSLGSVSLPVVVTLDLSTRPRIDRVTLDVTMEREGARVHHLSAPFLAPAQSISPDGPTQRPSDLPSPRSQE